MNIGRNIKLMMLCTVFYIVCVMSSDDDDYHEYQKQRLIAYEEARAKATKEFVDEKMNETAKFTYANDEDLFYIAANLSNTKCKTEELSLQNTKNKIFSITGVFSILDSLSNNTSLKYLYIERPNYIYTASQPTKDNTKLEKLYLTEVDPSFIENLAPYLKSFTKLKSLWLLTDNQELNCTDFEHIIKDHKLDNLTINFKNCDLMNLEKSSTIESNDDGNQLLKDFMYRMRMIEENENKQRKY